MDGLLKALLTAAVVLMVMAAARRSGHRLAGLVAALPTITAPTLAWLAHAEGIEFAIAAAIGSVAACAMLAVFALGYARAARRGGALVALIGGVGGALAMALPAEAASADLTWALTLALVSCAMVSAVMPDLGADTAARWEAGTSIWWVAAAAGALTALAASIGPAMGGFCAGLLSSLPLITGSVAVSEHARGGHRAAANFLRGYVGGLFGKAAFGTVFVLLAPRAGALAALALACACACLISTLRLRPPPQLALSRDPE